MERMIESRDIKHMACVERVNQLEKENKNLKSDLENLRELNRKQSKAFKDAMRDYRGLLRDYMKLEEENKKLKEERVDLISFNENYSPDVIVKYVDRYEILYNEVDIECAKLRDENRKLKEKLDNRDLLLEGKRKEVQTLFKINEQLAQENKKLKEELEKYKKQYEHSMGEDDELIYEEGLYD